MLTANEQMFKNMLELLKIDLKGLGKCIFSILKSLAEKGEPNMIYALYKQINIMSYLLETLAKDKFVSFVLSELTNIFELEEKIKESGVISLLEDFKEHKGIEIVSKYLSSTNVDEKNIAEYVKKQFQNLIDSKK